MRKLLSILAAGGLLCAAAPLVAHAASAPASQPATYPGMRAIGGKTGGMSKIGTTPATYFSGYRKIGRNEYPADHMPASQSVKK